MSVCTECISEPVSWFVLEQYKLGELDASAANDIESHLLHCPACTEVFEYLKKDEVLLPSLPTRLPKTAPVRADNRRPFAQVAWIIAAASLAAAAAAMLVLNLPIRTSVSVPPARRIAAKGGALSLSIVRLRGDSALENPTQFDNRDRFHLLLTSPFEKEMPVKVVIFQDDEAFFPYLESLTVSPGNQRAIEGAFMLSGDKEAAVCVMVGPLLPTNRELEKAGLEALPETSVCRVLTPFINDK